MRATVPEQWLRLGSFGEAVKERLAAWEAADVRGCLRAKDPSLWPYADAEAVSSRLGWLDLPQDIWLELDGFHEAAAEARSRGVEHTILVGMGGSSLAPLVLEHCFRPPAERRLTVLDTTHPDSVRPLVDQVRRDGWQCVVSSKSGSTLETRALADVLLHCFGRWSSRPGESFLAITDAGSPLEDFAVEHEFRGVYRGNETVGGRFSALSVFGLLPAALSGLDIEQILRRAHAMEDECLRNLTSPGLELGAALGELALAGRDKLTLLATPPLTAFPLWLDQLVAESLGKEGKGLVPIVGEPRAAADAYGDDRIFVSLTLGDPPEALAGWLQELEERGHPTISVRLRDPYDLGGEFFRWQLAVAMAATVLEVNPFDQPDVEAAKQATQRVLDGPDPADQESEPLPESISTGDRDRLSVALTDWLGSAGEGDYFAILTYAPPSVEMDRELAELQRRVHELSGRPTTACYGPRYLHSSGQLHKGGGSQGVFLQIQPAPMADLLVPGREESLGKIVAAQADGDAAALVAAGRRLVRVQPDGDVRRALFLLRQLLNR